MKFEMPIVKVEDKIKDFLRDLSFSENKIEKLDEQIIELTDSILEDIKFNVQFIIEEC